MRLCIIWAEADGFTEGCEPWLVLIGLGQHESEIVLGFGKVRAQTNCLAELRGDFAVACTLSAKQEAKHVMRLRLIGMCGQRFAEIGDGGIPIRLRNG